MSDRLPLTVDRVREEEKWVLAVGVEGPGISTFEPTSHEPRAHESLDLQEKGLELELELEMEMEMACGTAYPTLPSHPSGQHKQDQPRRDPAVELRTRRKKH